MKKFVAILLAAVLMLALAVPAFAYWDLYLYEPTNPEVKGGRVLKKYTEIDDRDEALQYVYSYGTFEGQKLSGKEYEYYGNSNEAYIRREKLDGEWKYIEEHSYTYDKHGNISGLNCYYYDKNGDKTLSYYINYLEKDADGNVTKYESYNDDYNGGYYKNITSELKYSDGNLTYQNTNSCYPDGSFHDRNIYLYNYNENGSLSFLESSYYYLEDGQTPYSTYRYECEYDEDDNIICKTNINNGVKSSTTEYSYDSEGRITYYHNKYYDEQGAVVDDKYHWEISYEDTEDGYIAITEKVNHQAPGAKVELEEEELSEETSIEAKNATAGVREKYNKEVVTLDEYGNMIKVVMFSWNEQNSDWDAYKTRTWEFFEKSERSENPIIIDGKYDDEPTNEVNPNTGAPVMSVALATVVCGAALIICKKHK